MKQLLFLFIITFGAFLATKEVPKKPDIIVIFSNGHALQDRDTEAVAMFDKEKGGMKMV
jgi:hypothetical protein